MSRSLLQNGSLDDALHSRRPRLAAAPVRLDWVSRTRIAAETASALMYLHSLPPSGFAHGGLRPSCILLDRECSAQIGDAAIQSVFGQPQVLAVTSPLSHWFWVNRLLPSMCFHARSLSAPVRKVLQVR